MAKAMSYGTAVPAVTGNCRGDWESMNLGFQESVVGNKPGGGTKTVLEAGCEGE